MSHLESFPTTHTQPNGLHQPNPFSLEGKLALITGGGTGIGLEIARCMAVAGATVIITGRREEVLQDAVADLGESVHYLTNDVCELDKLEGLVAHMARWTSWSTMPG
jgi:NADP-dependent 3-hydroxy acid dehydrogenase YdfG